MTGARTALGTLTPAHVSPTPDNAVTYAERVTQAPGGEGAASASLRMARPAAITHGRQRCAAAQRERAAAARASSSLRTEAYMCTYSWPDSAWIAFITSSVTARRSLAPARSYESKVSGSPILILNFLETGAQRGRGGR